MKKIKLFIGCLVILLLPGCWDRLEIEQLAFVIAIGIDAAEEGGLFVTYQIANQTLDHEQGVSSDAISVHAPDFLSARDLVVAFVTREVLFTHTEVIIVSEELARREEFINLIKPAIRERQLSREVNIIVTKERAEEFIRNNQPSFETRPHKYFELLTNRWKDTGLVPDSTLHSLLHRMEEDSGVFLATYSTAIENDHSEGGDDEGNQDEYIPGEVRKRGGNPTQTIGSAVIKEGKMIASLTGEETRISLLLRPKKSVETMLVTYPDPIDENYNITTRLIIEDRTKVNVNTEGNAPVIDVKTPLKLEVLSIASNIDYVEDLQKQELLKNHIKKIIESKVNALIEKTQKQFGAEPFRWSLPARRNFLTNQQYYDYNWMEKYRNAIVNFEVEIELKEFGKQLAPTDMEEIKD